MSDNTDKFKLIGGLYLGLDDGSDKTSILSFVRSILLPLITNYQRYKTKRTYKNAIKSAKAAIIARNMSHNLGSHVLYYLRQYLSGDITQFNEILENIVIKENERGELSILYKKEITSGKYELSPIIDKRFEVPFLRGLGSFLTYLQERQDFIASVATDSIPSYTTVNFKNFVIDNLLKDKKAIRHGKESRKEKNILLDFIAKSENTVVEITFNGHSLNNTIPLSKENDATDLYSFMVDLPGGVLGRQAIYSILENLIRNAAKHGFKNEETDKELKIDISIEVSKEYPDYFTVRVTDNIPLEPNNHVDELLQGYLTEDLIDHSHKLIDDHKGLKEILISALWLCGANVADINNADRKKYIEVRKSKTGCLQYVFYLYRAKSLMIVYDEKQAVNEFKDYTCIDYDTYWLNKDKCKRYNLVVDCTSDSKLDREKEGFRRYLKDIINPAKTADKKTYLEYFKRFLAESFGEEVLDDTKFLFFIDERQLPSTPAISVIQDDDLRALFHDVDGYINLSSKIYADNSTPKRKIAFRRHLQDIPDEFFVPRFDIYKAPHNTCKKLEESKERYISLESVTGNNSSFSMIANAPIDDHWVLRQLEAGYAKVLIIDERLFDTFKTTSTNIKTEIDPASVSANAVKQKYDCTNALLMSMKNVEIANVTEGILTNIWNMKIGSYKGETHEFSIDKGTKYHYISIHQGVLDKLFNVYGKEYKEKKEKFFELILNNLKKMASIKCLIHTGRGKPNYIAGRMAYRSLSDLDNALKEPKIYLLDYFNCATYE